MTGNPLEILCFISRGIDPALMICFAAIIDETLENTMRLNCELSARKVMRRSQSDSIFLLHSERSNEKLK